MHAFKISCRIGIVALCLGCLPPQELWGAQEKTDDANSKITERNELFRRAMRLEAGGKYLEAIPLLQQVVPMDEASVGRTGPATLNSCRALGGVLRAARQFEACDQVYRDLVKRYEEPPDANSPALIRLLTDLGNLQMDLKKVNRSEPFHRRAMILAQKAKRQDAAEAYAMTGLGLYFYDVGEFSNAVPLLRGARKLLQLNHAQNTKQYIALLNSLGSALAKLQQIEESLKLSQEALALLHEMKVENDPVLLLTLKNYGVLAMQAGRLDDAQRLLQNAFELNLGLRGAENEFNADFLLDLGQVALLKGDYKQAELLTRRARQMRATTSSDLQKKRISQQLASIAGATGRFGAAFELETEVLELEQSAIEPIFNVGTEKGMAEYMERAHGNLERLCYLAAVVQPTDAMAGATALTWVLRRKGIISALICEFREQEGMAARDPAIAPMVARLKNQRSALARVAVGNEAEDSPEKRSRIEQLEFQCDQTERQLHSKLSAYKRKHKLHRVELDDLRKRLPQQSVLIEYFSLREFKFKNTILESAWGPAHFYAFILDAKEDVPVRLVDLGIASVIEKAIQKFRKKFENTPRDLRASDEKSVEEDFRKTSNDLHELIFAPIRAHLGQAKLIYLAPDGALSQIPFEALSDKEDKYLIDQFQFAYLVTGRDLLRPQLKPITNGAILANQRVTPASGPPGRRPANQVGRGNGPAPPRPGMNPRPPGPGNPGSPGGLSARNGNGERTAAGVVVFAGPDFDLKPEARRPGARPVPSAGEDQKATRGTGLVETRGLRWQSLAGAAAEAQDILESRVDLRYGSIKTFVGDQALESYFKHMPAPRVLHIATHGFFLPDKTPSGTDAKPELDESEETRGGAGFSRLREMRDPMRRSGIVLAGANAMEENYRAGIDDGLVTAEEIALMDLHGTELVVLSACETGLGDVRLGDGVFGLRRAFLFAGARTLVTSLFEVPDIETRALMKSFYQELAKGTGKLDALHKAKLALKAERLAKNEAAHPFFWASFILIGESR